MATRMGQRMAENLKILASLGLGCLIGCTSPGRQLQPLPSSKALRAIAPPEQLTSVGRTASDAGLIGTEGLTRHTSENSGLDVQMVGYVQPIPAPGDGGNDSERFEEDGAAIVVDVKEDPIESFKREPLVGSSAFSFKASDGRTHGAVFEVASAVPRGDLESGSRVKAVQAELNDAIPMNLPSVLAAVDSSHPVVGQAQWSVQQAYAVVDQADVLWLPSIQAGFSFHRHDGNYQASNGQIVDVNRNSFQFGLGSGATGAGTTNTRPGLIADFRLADAIFQPRVARRNAWARGHAAKAIINEQMMSAALAYFDFLDAHQDLQIVDDSQNRFDELAELTVDFAEAGEGLNADADRLRTELALVKNRRIQLEEGVEVAEARLARAISLSQVGRLIPMDSSVLPIEFSSQLDDESSHVQTALIMRPELKESQALVSAACEAYRQEKYAPFIPSVLLGFSSSGFGGGLGNNLDNVDERYDFDALMSWRVRNLGLGESAIRRDRAARIQQARYAKLRIMDDVALEVREALSQVRNRRRQIENAKTAIRTAEESYRLNLERIRDGEGLPLEALQSAQALEMTQREYLRSVIRYNQAQIRLQWATGFPVSAM